MKNFKLLIILLCIPVLITCKKDGSAQTANPDTNTEINLGINQILAAIPAKYKVVSKAFVKEGYMARGEFDLEFPNKYGCDDLSKGEGGIEINITIYNNQFRINMLEKQIPFQTRLDTLSKYTPSPDPNNTLVTYGKPKVVSLEGGLAVYYIKNTSCLMSQYDDYNYVFVKSLQGSTAKAIEINVGGAIPSEEAISMVRELYTNLNALTY